jgi:hypothetical protein
MRWCMMHWSLGLEASTDIATMKMWSVAHKMVESGGARWFVMNWKDLCVEFGWLKASHGTLFLASCFITWYCLFNYSACFHRAGSRRVGIVWTEIMFTIINELRVSILYYRCPQVGKQSSANHRIIAVRIPKTNLHLSLHCLFHIFWTPQPTSS